MRRIEVYFLDIVERRVVVTAEQAGVILDGIGIGVGVEGACGEVPSTFTKM